MTNVTHLHYNIHCQTLQYNIELIISHPNHQFIAMFDHIICKSIIHARHLAVIIDVVLEYTHIQIKQLLENISRMYIILNYQTSILISS